MNWQATGAGAGGGGVPSGDPFALAETDVRATVASPWWQSAPPPQRAEAITRRMLAGAGEWWLFGAWGRWYRCGLDGNWQPSPPPIDPRARQVVTPAPAGYGNPPVPPQFLPVGPDLVAGPATSTGFLGTAPQTDVVARIQQALISALSVNPAQFTLQDPTFATGTPSTLAAAWAALLWCAGAPVVLAEHPLVELFVPYLTLPAHQLRWLIAPDISQLAAYYTTHLNAGDAIGASHMLRVLYEVGSGLRGDPRFRPGADALTTIADASMRLLQNDLAAVRYGHATIVQEWRRRCPADYALPLLRDVSPGEYLRLALYDLTQLVAAVHTGGGHIEQRRAAVAVLGADLQTVPGVVAAVAPWLDSDSARTLHEVVTQPAHPLRELWPREGRLPQQLRGGDPGTLERLLATSYTLVLTSCRLGGSALPPGGFTVATAVAAELTSPALQPPKDTGELTPWQIIDAARAHLAAERADREDAASAAEQAEESSRDSRVAETAQDSRPAEGAKDLTAREPGEDAQAASARTGAAAEAAPAPPAPAPASAPSPPPMAPPPTAPPPAPASAVVPPPAPPAPPVSTPPPAPPIPAGSPSPAPPAPMPAMPASPMPAAPMPSAPPPAPPAAPYPPAAAMPGTFTAPPPPPPAPGTVMPQPLPQGAPPMAPPPAPAGARPEAPQVPVMPVPGPPTMPQPAAPASAPPPFASPGGPAPVATTGAGPVVEVYGIRFLCGPDDVERLIAEVRRRGKWSHSLRGQEVSSASAPALLLIGAPSTGQRRLTRMVARALAEVEVTSDEMRTMKALDLRAGGPEGIRTALDAHSGHTLLLEGLDELVLDGERGRAYAEALYRARVEGVSDTALVATCEPERFSALSTAAPELVTDFRAVRMPDLSDPGMRAILLALMTEERHARLSDEAWQVARADLARLKGHGRLINARLIEVYFDRACSRSLGRRAADTQALGRNSGLVLTPADFERIADELLRPPPPWSPDPWSTATWSPDR